MNPNDNKRFRSFSGANFGLGSTGPTGFNESSVNMLINQQLKLDKLEERFESQTKELKEYRRTIAGYSADFKKFNDSVESKLVDTNHQVDTLKISTRETRDKTLEPLAIFVGLFTFASISFQVFANVRDFELWTPLLVVIAGVLTIFSGLVIHATSISIDVDRRRKVTASIIALGLILTIFGSALYAIGNSTLAAKHAKDCVSLMLEEDKGKQTFCRQ